MQAKEAVPRGVDGFLSQTGSWEGQLVNMNYAPTTTTTGAPAGAVTYTSSTLGLK